MYTTSKKVSDYYHEFLKEGVTLIRLARVAAQREVEKDGPLPGYLGVGGYGYEIARVTNIEQLKSVSDVLTGTPASVTSALDVVSAKVTYAYTYFAESEQKIARGKSVDRQGEFWDCKTRDVFMHEISAQFWAAHVALARMQISFETFCRLITFEYYCPPDPCDDLFIGKTSPKDPTFWVRPTLAPVYPPGFFAGPGPAYPPRPFAQRTAAEQQAMGRGYAAESATAKSYEKTIDDLKRTLASYEEKLRTCQKELEETRASTSTRKAK